MTSLAADTRPCVLIFSICKFHKLFNNCYLFNFSVALFIFISTFPVENWRPLCSKEILFDALDDPNLFCELQGQ